MRTTTILTAAALAGALGAALIGRAPARADGLTCAAIVAGVEASAGTVPELVVWNAAPGEITLDLTLRKSDGTPAVTRAAALVVGPRTTARLDLNAELRRDLPKGTKPYSGLLTVELRGAPPFAASTALVHVTQYWGSRKRPRTAFVLRPLFRDETDL